MAVLVQTETAFLFSGIVEKIKVIGIKKAPA
jgi:hypothetical protein